MISSYHYQGQLDSSVTICTKTQCRMNQKYILIMGSKQVCLEWYCDWKRYVWNPKIGVKRWKVISKICFAFVELLDLSNAIIVQLWLPFAVQKSLQVKSHWWKTELCSHSSSIQTCRCPCTFVCNHWCNYVHNTSPPPGCAAPSWSFITVTLRQAVHVRRQIHSKGTFSKLT